MTRLTTAGLLLLVGLLPAQVDDRLINDDTLSGCPQLAPDIVQVGGRWLVAWEDYRKSDYDADIRCRLYESDGRVHDASWVVNGDTTSRAFWNYRQLTPTVAANAAGPTLIGWEDYRAGNSRIHARVLDARLHPVGADLPVAPGVSFAPDAAALGEGFVLVWRQPEAGSRQSIRAALVDASGNAGPPLLVSDEADIDTGSRPSVAAAPDGFIVTWQQAGAVRLRSFDLQGNPRSPGAILAATRPGRPRLAVTGTGAGIVLWSQPGIIQGQLFDTQGNAVGGTFPVADSGADPAIAAAPEGMKYLAAWEDRSRGNTRVVTQYLDLAGTPLTPAIPIDAEAGGRQLAPSVAPTWNDAWAAVWIDWRNGDPDIFGTWRPARPNPARVNDDWGSALQDFPVITQDAQERSSVFWFDFREGPDRSAIWGQRLDEDLCPVGGNFRVSLNPPESRASFLWAATNASGMTVVAWQDDRGGNSDIYARTYDSAGQALGPDFRVNDDSGDALQSWPLVALNDSGEFLVVWSDDRTNVISPFAQLYDRTGTPAGPNRRVDYSGREPGAWLSNAGDYWITWKATSGIRARHYGPDQEPLDSLLRVSDGATRTLASPELIVTDLGTVWVAWMDFRRGAWDIYAQRLGSDRSLLGPNFRVNDDIVLCEHDLPALSFDEEQTVYLTWTDFRLEGNLDVRCRRYDTTGTPLDSSFTVNTDPAPGVHQWAYGSVAAQPNRTLFTWIDNRNQRSWDVYVRAGLPGADRVRPGRSVRAMPSIASDHVRLRPVDALTGPARLRVYDLTGRLCRDVLLPADAAPVSYIELDCRMLPAGVYFPVILNSGRQYQGRFTIVR